MTPAHQIAEKLTEAQRNAIKRSNGRSVTGLNDISLDELEFHGVTGDDGWIDQLTPLGLALRAHLLSKEPEQ